MQKSQEKGIKMASILQINSSNIRPQKQLQPKNTRYNTPKLASLPNNQNVLLNFMDLLSKNNAASISFGAGQRWAHVGWGFNNLHLNVPDDEGVSLSQETKNLIRSEATTHINGDFAWPQIDNINAWMISAETENFIPIGGLAKVADDLPNSFNERFKDSKSEMSIITPMYVDGKVNKLEINGNTANYTGKNAALTLEKITDLDVEMFDEWHNDMSTRKVTVYKGTMVKNDGTKTPYIMFYEPQIFNTIPDTSKEEYRAKNENCKGCYVHNTDGFDENIRFAFFSKCVYELAKKLKADGPQGGVIAPNVMIMNDWHVGSVAPLMKYLAPAQADNGEISQPVADYFRKTPTLFIAHNLGYQGDVEAKGGFDPRTKILGTLFGKYTKPIMAYSYNHDYLPAEDKNTLFKYHKLNPGMMGLALTDRVIPVSVNYGEELLASSEFGKGMQNLLRIRNDHNTFAPITNGYSKTLVDPTAKNIDGWLNQVAKDLKNDDPDLNIPTNDIKLEPYTIKEMKKVRDKNKKQIFKLLNKIIERERKTPEANAPTLAGIEKGRKYMLYKPNETNLSDIKDITKVPVMTFVGRVAGQKGMDTIFKRALIDLARAYEADKNLPEDRRKYTNWEVPVIIIGGTVAEARCYKELENLKKELRHISPKFADRMLLFKDYANTNLLALGTDFFLIPSNFEPCGLIQMEVMAKGVIPIASATGGLVSTIRDTYNGFLSTVFYDKEDNWQMEKANDGKMVYAGTNMKDIPATNWKGFEDAMEKALHTYFNLPKKLVKMQKTAMLKDFSWTIDGGALDKYVTLMKSGKYTNTERTSYFNMPDERNERPYPELDNTLNPNKKTK